jgi:hypothetical protein
VSNADAASVGSHVEDEAIRDVVAERRARRPGHPRRRGVALIAVGLFLPGGIEVSVVGIAVAAFDGWLVVTGATGLCPLCVPLSIATLPKMQGVPSIEPSMQAA